MKYDTVRYNLTPVVDGPYVGYGPEVDAMWDHISDSMSAPTDFDGLC